MKEMKSISHHDIPKVSFDLRQEKKKKKEKKNNNNNKIKKVRGKEKNGVLNISSHKIEFEKSTHGSVRG
jgi:hypothetical protein